MNWRHCTRGALLVISLALGACATHPSLLPPQTADTLQRWAMEGKLGVTLPDDRVNAYLSWQQDQDHFLIKLSGLFGQGSTEIEGSEDHIALTRGQQTLQGASAEEIMLRELGWSVPVEHFAYWAKGVPSPLVPVDAITRDELGAITKISQAGWQVELSRYQAVASWQLPSRLVAKTDTISLLLVVKDWQLQ
ncbi:lipoprotein insertase outer membrane protein LolB [Halioxenophilus sp. WMMB6]|uniref:lipoprotein insertase outer membrane protein LolB n=1 Tax=Halioxenophilus sp. WMMB6 TaxID=3073815 RepID=UPI00295EF6C7|nr:lipoprotein insertase outer membrane protein LolB [Halioxenophilus sp. WMMB6]